MSPDRQRIVRVQGRRRAQLTPAPGTIPEPVKADEAAAPVAERPSESGPNDERLRLDVPPHY
ncbi:hypothetical protein [Microbacterium memoriense]|uniref:Uncharacterized protein n=1 Tax=Microbacterium memoriense TaxID=2978350 RepID=A0ABT2P8T3_9MICO|nr:hypothetical protein [Microbacterium memoriense]MCT9001007.1 hypothetical protein [Microbacterium memoriense]